MDLMDKGWLDEVSCEFDKSKELIRFLDAFVIKLEGGSDEDIKLILDGAASGKEQEAEKKSTIQQQQQFELKMKS